MLPITLIKRFVISIILLSAAVPVSFAMTSFSVMDAGDKGIYVRGKVTDASDGKPLEYANITALDTLGNLRASAISHPDGHFSMRLPAAGPYKVFVSFVGYKSWSKDIVGKGKELLIGAIALEEGEELEGAAVQAVQMFSKESDRFVYDVQADPDAKRMEMMDFMSKIPELGRNSASGRLEFRDEQINEILIDDKENGMINAGRQYPMNFIRASYMSKIELVLPGSPEYNNDKPILLITLDEPLPLGFAGKLSGSADTKGTYSPGIDLVGNTPWIGIGVNYSFGYSAPAALTNSTERKATGETSLSNLENSSTSWSRSMSHNLGMNLFRSFLDDKLDLNITLSTSRADSENFSDANSTTTDADGNLIKTTGNSSNAKSWSPMRFNAGLSISQKWGGKNGKENSYTLKYSYKDKRNCNEQNMLYSVSESGITEDEDRMVNSGSGSKEHNLDFTLRLRDPGPKRLWGLYATAGYINRYYDSATDYMLLDPVSGIYQSESARFDGLDYRQQVTHARLNFIGSAIRRKLGYGVFIQGENLNNKGMFLSNGGSPLDYNEFNFMPGASLRFRHKGFSIGGGYSQRIRRPNIDQLNPYVDETDPENLKTGNPELKGERVHSIAGSVGYDSRGWLSNVLLSYSYNTSNNAIESMTFIDKDNISTTTWQNLGSRYSHNIGLNLRFRPMKSMTIHIGGGYVMSTYGFADGRENKINTFNATCSISGTVLGISYHSTLGINPAVMTAQSTEYELYPNWHVVLSKYFKKIHLGVALYANDILHSSRPVESTISGADFVQHSLTQRLGRNFQFSVYWEFGKFKNPPTVQNEAYDSFDAK